MKLKRPGMSKLDRKKFLAVGEACVGFKCSASSSSGFSTDETLISASAVPHCWKERKKVERREERRTEGKKEEKKDRRK